LQEQSKRESFELENQELRTRGTEPFRTTLASNNAQDAPPIAEMGLRRRSSFSSEKPISTSHGIDTDKNERNKSRNQEDQSSLNVMAPNSLDLTPLSGENKANIHSRTNTRSRVPTVYMSPILIRSWVQGILVALVFFILGRMFRS